MGRDTGHLLVLQAYAGQAFLPVACSFVENTAIALGLGNEEALGLALATEEVFGHLCRVILKNEERVEICCTSGGYYVQADFTFPASDIDLRAFNLHATVSFTDDAALEEMGLVLASRFVDRFQVSRQNGEGLKLTLLKEKAYPEWEPSPVELPKPTDDFSVRAPSPEELKLFAHLVQTCCRDQAIPQVFNWPGKLVDMMAARQYDAAVAVGPAGEIIGGAFWHRTGERAIECFGPYSFNQKAGSTVLSALLESCIEAIARTSVVVLINRFASPEFARQHLEPLGGIHMHTIQGKPFRREAWFRLLHEDAGSIAWVHPELEGFLRREYERLVLPREMRLVTNEGEQHSRYSVLSTTFDRPHASATLSPIWFGTDLEKNLGQHLDLFRRESIANIFFVLDVGESWQAAFIPGLLKSGFEPRLIFPCSGAGDVVLFQFQEASS